MPWEPVCMWFFNENFISDLLPDLIALFAVLDDLAEHDAVVGGQLEAELVDADPLFGCGGRLICHVQFWRQTPSVPFAIFLVYQEREVE